MAAITIHYSDGRTEERTLSSGEQMIGREPDCELLVLDPSISRHHARIFTDAMGVYYLEDHKSKNGTLVNGHHIKRHRLEDSDRISLGAIELVFHRPVEEDEDTTRLVDLHDDPVNLDSASFVPPQRQLVLSQQRLRMLYEFSDRLTSLRDRSELLEDVMNICFETLQFERGLIVLKHPRGQEPECPVMRNLKEDESGRLRISRSLINRSLMDGERCIINDPVLDMETPTESIAEYQIRSAMCVPIAYRDEILGAIYGDRITSSTRYGQDDVDFLAGLARQVSVGLMNYRLFREREQRLQLENEISVARQIQQDLYPKKPLVRDDVQVVGCNEPGRFVSGDYYDVLEREDGRVAVLIADVSGKGIAAALLTANLQAAVHVMLPLADGLAEAVTRWNRLIHDNTDASKFITASVGLFDPRSRRFEWVSAGHAPPYLLESSEQVRPLSTQQHYPLGVIASECYRANTIDVPANSTLLFFTDGVTEAMRPDGEQYGDARLETCLRASVGAAPADLVQTVRADVSSFVGNAPQSDDITLLALHCA